jgi:RNA polymerase sigma factor (sigma-70 family)
VDHNRALDPIIAQRARFRAYLVARLGNDADADDVLQNSLVKAIRSSGDVPAAEKLTAWFYRLLRNALVDHVRSRSARVRRDTSWTINEERAGEMSEKTLCACFEHMMNGLKPREAELVRRAELGDEALAEVARSLGISPGNASVALHRARLLLRKRLEEFCGECAQGACLDCDCPEPGG